MAWNDTKQGAELATAWDRFRAMLNSWVPQHQEQLRQLAQRAVDR